MEAILKYTFTGPRPVSSDPVTLSLSDVKIAKLNPRPVLSAIYSLLQSNTLPNNSTPCIDLGDTRAPLLSSAAVDP